jgi:hypothetical protein
MKRLLLILILTSSFQTLTKADEIKDFEIQGLTIGDSLLQMYSEKEIKEYSKINSNIYPSSKKYFTLGTHGKDENYDQFNVDLKYNDKDYIIYGLSQYKRMKYKNCLKEMKIITKDIKKIFNQKKYKLTELTQIPRVDTSGNSKYTSTDFAFRDGSSLRIICTDWGKEFEADNFSDNIDVSLASSQLNNWLTNEAY